MLKKIEQTLKHAMVFYHSGYQPGGQDLTRGPKINMKGQRRILKKEKKEKKVKSEIREKTLLSIFLVLLEALIN